MDSYLVKEAARQVIALAFTAATVVVIRYVAKPDAARTLKMRAALNGKRLAQREADRWQVWADRCGTWYNSEKA